VPGLWLQKAIADFNPDVVHVASPFMLGGQAIAAADRLGIPSVAIYQTALTGYLDRYNMTLAKPLLDRMTATIHAPATLNLAPTQEAASYLNGLGLDRVSVWGRGVDLDLYHPNRKFEPETEQLRAKFAPNGERIVGYVGRLAAEKQVHRMAELFDLPNTRFVIVGDGPERKKLETDFAGKPVSFAGRLSGLDLARAYASFDAFVHFGTEETFGQTIQEAQASGLPVVAPESGGPRFLIEDGVSGYLVHPTKKHAYNKPVKHLLDDQQLHARIAEQARRAVLAKSWEANNAALIEHYRVAMQQVADKKAARLEVA
jgi:phosphatidylinositol alpha 1,6-mannosyltransferase